MQQGNSCEFGELRPEETIGLGFREDDVAVELWLPFRAILAVMAAAAFRPVERSESHHLANFDEVAKLDGMDKILCGFNARLCGE